MRKRHLLTIAPALTLLLIGGRAEALAESPTAMLRRTNNRLIQLLKKEQKRGADKSIDAALRRAVRGFLDFKELARRALSKHWEKRTDKERQEFVDLLGELIRRNYLKQLRENLGYKLIYRSEKVSGNLATVDTVVRVTKKGRTSEVTITYKLHKVDGKWTAFDVITDDVSVVQNYRSQFNRIIRRKSYQVLVEKMRRKLGRTG